MASYRKQIASLKKILDELEKIYDRRTPQFGAVSKKQLNELRHRTIFVHAEIDGGMTLIILHYFYPKGALVREDSKGTQLARVGFLYTNFLENLGFARRLEIFKKLIEVYEFEPNLPELLKKVNDLRNDFAHPTAKSLSKYLTFKNLHQAYVDLVEGFTAFKVAIEKVKKSNLSLE